MTETPAPAPPPRRLTDDPMAQPLFGEPNGAEPRIVALTQRAVAAFADALPDAQRAWLRAHGFEGRVGQIVSLPAAPDTPQAQQGHPGLAVIGLGDGSDPLAAGDAANLLAPITWRYDAAASTLPADGFCLAWGCGAYRFQSFKGNGRPQARLAWPDGIDRAAVTRMLRAVWRVRDLVNTPANHLGPAELAEVALAVAATHGAEARVIAGDDLLSANYPAIHAVGRASTRPPCLIDITWGDPGHRHLTLVGKGVCFDSGGLDIKNAAGMLLMKKDMGGAAHALALAEMVMEARLPVRLRLLIPAVENAISGDAFRPLDILATRAGLTVEVGNTDAEGRLILADALFEADRETPDLIIDFATLTGAARVALGPDVPALFCNRDDIANALVARATERGDPLWRLPLHAPYRADLASPIADLSNTGASSLAGAIYAALFMEAFLRNNSPWIHLDVFSWSDRPRPGRPRGGEAMGLRAVYQLLLDRYAAAPPGAQA